MNLDILEFIIFILYVFFHLPNLLEDFFGVFALPNRYEILVFLLVNPDLSVEPHSSPSQPMHNTLYLS